VTKVTRYAAGLAALLLLAVTCGVTGYAFGAYAQYQHTVLLQQSILARDILQAKMCKQSGCDSIMAWLVDDVPLHYSNVVAQDTLMHESMFNRLFEVSRITWKSKGDGQIDLKRSQYFESAISQCQCGLQASSLGK
jgi:hypothetical protein